MLPPDELEIGIVDVVKRNFGASPDEVILAVSRQLGFKATSSQLRDIIQESIDSMAARSALARQGNNLVLVESSI